MIVQTWDPEHPAVSLASRHDVDRFVAQEMAARRELAYPPFTRAALVRVDGPDEPEAREACGHLARTAKATELARWGSVLVQGPAPAPITPPASSPA